MDKKIKIIAVASISVCIIMRFTNLYAESSELSEYQKEIASNVAKVTMDNWEEYGVLPSVAVVQTFVESSLGEHQVRPNNLWGLRPGGEFSSYPTLESGIHAYLKVINNGRYDEALFKKDYHEQLNYILKGGYYGEDDGGTNEWYYNNCVKSIEKYGFYKYDEQLFETIKEKKEKKRKKKWEKTYTLHYDPTLRGNMVRVDEKIIEGGSIQIWEKDEMKGIYDVSFGQKGTNISVPDKRLDGIKVKIIVNEEAKG